MTPPRTARWLLARLLRPDDRALFLADVDEAYEREVTHAGTAAARRWYWRQTATSLGPLVWHRLARRRYANTI